MEWTHTYRKKFESRKEWLAIREEAPPHDGNTYWFYSRRGVWRSFKLDDESLRELKKKVTK